VLACALLAGVALLLFGRAPLSGGVLAPTDNVFATPFFAGEAPRDFRVPRNPLLLDQVYQFVPWRRFAWETLREGRLPLWNPQSQAGDPLVATMQSAVFYPINLLLVAIPFDQTFAWSAILKLWIAGTLTFLLARQYRLCVQAALVSAVAFMLSSYLVVWLGHPDTNVAVWLPGILLLDELLLSSSTRAEQVRNAVLLGLLVGVQFTGGHPETSADVLVAAGLYHLLRWMQLVRPTAAPLSSKIGRLVVLPTASLLLGVCLASIQLLPFLEWLPLSAEFRSRSAEGGFQVVQFWKYLFLIPLALFPNLYGNPTWPLPPYRSLLPWGQNFNEDVLYVGILPLILAIVALLKWRSRHPAVTVWFIMGVVALGRALHVPVLNLLNRLPILNLGNPHRQRLVWCLSIAILAGFGAQAWWEQLLDAKAKSTRRWLRLNAAVVALGAVLAVIGAGILPHMKKVLTEVGRRVAEREFATRADGSFPLEHYYGRVNEAVTKMLWSFRLDNIDMYLPALVSAAAFAVAFWAVRRPATRRHVVPVAVLALTIVDLLAFAWRYNPIIKVSDFYPTPSSLGPVLRDRSLYRFTATGLDLFPDAQMMYGLSDVRSFDFSTHWFSTYVGMIPETTRWSAGTTFEDFKSPLLQVLNIKYVFSSRPEAPTGASAATVAFGGSGPERLWRLREVQPRSFLVRHAFVATSDSEAVSAIQAAPDSIYHRVVLSAPAPMPPVPSGGRPVLAGQAAQVTLLRYDAQSSAWHVRSSDAGYLVTTDAYYPGWRAYVDGRRTPIYRANVAFRAVELPPGEHRVEYRYEPDWLPIAAVLEVAALLLVAGALIWSFTAQELTRRATSPRFPR